MGWATPRFRHIPPPSRMSPMAMPNVIRNYRYSISPLFVTKTLGTTLSSPMPVKSVTRTHKLTNVKIPYPNRLQNLTVGKRRNWKNRGFLKQRKPKLVRTEQLKYIHLLHERGEGSLKISKQLGLSRNTAHKYLRSLIADSPSIVFS